MALKKSTRFNTIPPSLRIYQEMRNSTSTLREGQSSTPTLVVGWKPSPGPQRMGFMSRADELFYGGAAGGGKTELLLGLSLTVHKASIIFRREYPQLRGIIERTRELISTHGSYNGSDHVWHLEDGRILELGAVKQESDVQKYQGRAHDFLGFDEITHFTELQYRFLNGWKRTAIPGQRVRTVATGNPPVSSEGEWVIRYWAPWLDDKYPNRAKNGELRWFAVIGDKDVEVGGPEPLLHKGEIISPKSRTFIMAKVDDNPYYLKTDYRSQLQALPEPLRSQMLYGNFEIGIEDDPWQTIPTQWVMEAMDRWERLEKPADIPLTAVGVDVARGGRDKTVLSMRYGYWFDELQKFPGSTTPDGAHVATLVYQAVGDQEAAVNVDVIGVGSSVFDHLKDGLSGPVAGVNFGEKSNAVDRSKRLSFVNLRAECYWKMREALDPVNGEGLALPPDRELLADLCSPKWMMRSRGIQIESKEDIKQRLGRSTDCGDAVVLALHHARRGVHFG